MPTYGICDNDEGDVDKSDEGKSQYEAKKKVGDARRAILILDKPNLHRLWEFAFMVFPTTRHAKATQELHLERTHAALRKSFERSKRTFENLFEMRNAVVDDWK